MKKAKIYTRGGDKGETSLVGGTRVLKSDQRIDLYGDVDELNSYVGLILSLMSEEFQADQTLLEETQLFFFKLGSLLACELEFREKYKLDQLDSILTVKIESRIDLIDSELPKLTKFIMPGGEIFSSHLHLLRTKTRSVERKLIAFVEDNPVERIKHSVEFLNRFSDYCFVLARLVNNRSNNIEKKWNE